MESSDNTQRSVEKLVVSSWWNTDTEHGEGGERFFHEDATIVMPARTMRGRAEIIEGAKSRLKRGPRLARHLVNNLVVDPRSEDRAVARYVLLLFAKDGIAPLYAQGYSALADVTDECILIDGAWLIERRELRAVFIAPDNDSVMLVRPPHDIASADASGSNPQPG